MLQISEETLLNEKMRMAISGYPSAAMITSSTSLLLYFFLTPHSATDKIYIQLWFIMQMILCGIWLLLYFRYSKNYDPIKTIWEHWLEIPLNVISGLGWGLTWVLFINPDNLHTVILLNIVTSSALFVYVVSTPLHPAATNTGLLACTLPIILESHSIGGTLFTSIGIGAMILGTSVYLFGVELQKLYLRNLLQLQENQGLVTALRVEKQQVEEINQEKTRFLAAASHDLRQPIQALKLFETILRPLLTEPRQREILGKMGETNQSLLNLLDPLLELSKLDAGVIKLYPEWIYLDDLLYRIQQQYTDLAIKNKIQLRCSSTAQQIFADPRQLERILSNLVINAIKHMKRPGKILVGVRRQGISWRIEVWDNGQGVAEAEQHKIFQAFYQVNNPERHHSKGVGLGLTIVKRLADLMGCRLTFRSIFGKGCRFSLYFPPTTQFATLTTPATDTSQNSLSDETYFGVKYKVLIIEDDERIAEPLIALLSSWGLAAQAAHSIETAMQTIAHFLPDLVILDYQLRDNQTGLAVLEQVRQRLGYVMPALLLTGTTAEEYTQIFETLPFPVLYKPVEPERLKAMIIQLLL